MVFLTHMSSLTPKTLHPTSLNIEYRRIEYLKNHGFLLSLWISHQPYPSSLVYRLRSIWEKGRSLILRKNLW